MKKLHILTTKGVIDLQLLMSNGDITAIECISCGGSVVYCDCPLDDEPEWDQVREARQWIAEGTFDAHHRVGCNECNRSTLATNLSEWGYCIGCVIREAWAAVQP